MNFVASNMNIDVKEKQKLLEHDGLRIVNPLVYVDKSWIKEGAKIHLWSTHGTIKV